MEQQQEINKNFQSEEDSCENDNENKNEYGNNNEFSSIHTFFEDCLLFFSGLSLLSSVYFIISDLLKINKENVSFGFVNIIFISIVCIFYIIYFNNFVTSKTSSAATIRFIFFFMILVGIFSFLLRALVNPLFTSIGSFVLFFFISGIKTPYILHEYFLDQCEGKAGKNLFNALYADKFIGEDFLKSVKAYSNLLAITTIFFIVITSVLNYETKRFSIITNISIGIYLLCVFLHFALMSIYKKETYYAFMGFEKVFDTKEINYFGCFIIFLICCGLSFVFSSNHCLIDVKKLLELFDTIKYKTPKQVPQQALPEIEVDSPLMPSIDFGIVDSTSSLKIVQIILLVVEIVLITAVVSMIVIFLFKPFFTKEFRQYLRERKFDRILKLFVLNIKNLFHKILNFKRTKVLYAQTDGDAFSDSINKFLRKSKKSKEKKLELDKLTAQFVKIINWGNQNNIFYKASYAPKEYSMKISAVFEKNGMTLEKSAIEMIGFLFEKALYSEKLLSKQEENSFFENCNLVIANSVKNQEDFEDSNI